MGSEDQTAEERKTWQNIKESFVSWGSKAASGR